MKQKRPNSVKLLQNLTVWQVKHYTNFLKSSWGQAQKLYHS
ncbi:hypothetical protein HAINFHK1212_0754 [Haemophilus influenzae HK1212]|uniref:Uncharacterized protein n=1 Tax=Haemophilus influenzae HK1212 TaxID=456482 RepID=A0A7G2K063_HAEIF|nr:hypothetical protein HAINFHK1212_0754 [Haemophilus influenzae HK1212]